MNQALIVMVALLVTGVSVTFILFVFLVRRQTDRLLSQVYQCQPHTSTDKWQLPPPSADLALYKKVHGIFDELVEDRRKALLESSQFQIKIVKLSNANDELRKENIRLCDMLEMAQNVIRAHMHVGMKIQPPVPYSRPQ